MTPSAGPDAPPDLTVDAAPLVVPDDTAYAFLGAPGARVWDIEEPAGTAGLTLTGVEGPGALVIHRAGADTAPELLARSDAADGLPEDGYPIPPRPAEPAARPAARWAFTAPGTYRLTLADSAQAQPARRTRTSTVRVGAPALVTPAPQAQPVRLPPSTFPPSATDRTARALPAAPAPTPAAAKAAASGTVLAAGHIDIAARVVGGRMQIGIKDGTVAGRTVWREPSSVVLHVKAAAKKRIPAGGAFSFLGRAGAPVWLLDQVQQEGLLWPGWSTDNVEAGALKGGVKFALRGAEGPGGFALYTYDGLSGATVLFNSRDGVPDTVDVPANSHAHGGWAFGGEGVHRLTVSMTGTLANGSPSTDTETLTFVVGDAEDPATVDPAPSGSGGNTGGGTAPGTGGDGEGSAGTAGPAGPSGSSGPGGDARAASGSMADTGAGDTALLAAGAAGLAAAGTGLVLVNRRRERRNRNGAPA
ncbi:choice-of-anchor M domain-containing protein [Streptomyces sp. NPDC004787]|uniref:choice-of-anchor M domain-containing protein n=1 Tax=Streptomyces sp. NPDC004787 TaxID=3154291 RepID=UPI0033BDD33D